MMQIQSPPDLSEKLALQVVQPVANHRGIDPIDLEPLYYEVEIETVERLLDHGFDGFHEFDYAGCLARIDGTGEISVEKS